MKSAVGPMGWRPADFWSATMSEFFDAVEIFHEMHRDPKTVEAPTDDDLDNLLARYA